MQVPTAAACVCRFASSERRRLAVCHQQASYQFWQLAHWPALELDPNASWWNQWKLATFVLRSSALVPAHLRSLPSGRNSAACCWKNLIFFFCVECKQWMVLSAVSPDHCCSALCTAMPIVADLDKQDKSWLSEIVHQATFDSRFVSVDDWGLMQSSATDPRWKMKSQSELEHVFFLERSSGREIPGCARQDSAVTKPNQTPSVANFSSMIILLSALDFHQRRIPQK